MVKAKRSSSNRVTRVKSQSEHSGDSEGNTSRTRSRGSRKGNSTKKKNKTKTKVRKKSNNNLRKRGTNQVGKGTVSSVEEEPDVRLEPEGAASTMDSLDNRTISLTNHLTTRPHPPAVTGSSRVRYVGLRNGGATCYMNSIIQQLYHTPEIKQVVCTPAISKVRKDVLQQFHRLLQEMQTSRITVTPRRFWDVYKLWGQPISTWEQQDAYEFYTDLVTQLDEALENDGRPEIFKATFGGVLSDVYQCQGRCNHRFEREEEFYGLTVSVASNLHTSLQHLVREVEMSHDNAYLCEKCSEKRTAMKTSYIKTLPSLLVIQLKRFKHDKYGRVVKTNDYFEFPWMIDMAPYTLHSIMHQSQQENQNIDLAGATCATSDSEDPQLYYLVGVVIHCGSVNGGHYYSIIRDRQDMEDLTESGKARWLRCNDSVVGDHFMNEGILKSECYGGSSTYGYVQRSSNAYILFYQKITGNNAEKYRYENQDRQSVRLPPVDNVPLVARTGRTLSEMMSRSHGKDKCRTELQEETRTREVIKNIEDKVQELQMKLDAFFHGAKDPSDPLDGLTKDIKDLVSHSEAACILALGYFINNMADLVASSLITDPDKQIRQACAGIIFYTMEHYFRHRRTTRLGTAQHLDSLVEELLSLLDGDVVVRHLKTCGEFFCILAKYMSCDPSCIQQMLCHQVFKRLMLLSTRIASEKNQNEYDRFEETRRSLHAILATLILHTDVSSLQDENLDGKGFPKKHFVDGQLLQMTPDMHTLLSNEKEYVMYIQETVHVYFESNRKPVSTLADFERGSNPVAEVLHHLSFCNTFITVESIMQIMDRVATCPVAEDEPAIFQLLGQLLQIEDPLQETRVKLALEDTADGLFDIINRCKYSDQWRSYYCVQFLLDWWKNNQHIKDFLNANFDWWQSTRRWYFDRNMFEIEHRRRKQRERADSNDRMTHNTRHLSKLTLQNESSSSQVTGIRKTSYTQHGRGQEINRLGLRMPTSYL